MKTGIKGALDFALKARSKLREYVKSKTPPIAYSVLDELEVRCAKDTADFVEAHMQKALAFVDRLDLLRYAYSKTSLTGLIGEFGVWKGTSINLLGGLAPEEQIFGFDSFEGLAEDWSGTFVRKGAFSLGGRLPSVRHNVVLIKGWFDQTLPKFLTEYDGPFSFIHLDSDTYEAARIVFDNIGERIVSGTVIAFDEFFGYRGWKHGEYMAWMDFAEARGLKFEYLGFSFQQVAIKIL